VDRESGVIFLIRPPAELDGLEASSHIRATDMRICKYHSGAYYGCQSDANVFIRVARFSGEHKEVFAFVSQPGESASVSWTPPFLDERYFSEISVQPSMASGSTFEYGSTLVVYTASGFTGSTNLTTNFTIVVAVGLSFDITNVGRYYQKPDTLTPLGFVADYFLDNLRIFGGNQEIPDVLLDISQGVSVSLQSALPSDITFLFNENVTKAKLHADLRYCTSGQFPASDDSSLVYGVTNLTMVLGSSFVSNSGWQSIDSAVTRDGRCFRIKGSMQQWFTQNDISHVSRILFSLTFPTETVAPGLRLYSAQSPSQVLLELANGDNKPFLANPGTFVVLSDIVSPTVHCPNDVYWAVTKFKSGANVMWSQTSATDNVGSPAVTEAHNSGDYFYLKHSPYNVTFTAADAAGNKASCSFMVSLIYFPTSKSFVQTLPSLSLVSNSSALSLGTFITSQQLVCCGFRERAVFC
jgi:hypothetical protein